MLNPYQSTLYQDKITVVDKRYKDKKWLIEQYKKSTIKEIAKMCGCSRPTIYVHLHKYGIPFVHPSKKRNIPCRNREWLKEQFYSKLLNTKEISKLAGCGVETVQRYLKKFGMSRKNRCLYRNENGEKICRKCRQWKNEGDFCKHRCRVDGLSHVCKKCAGVEIKKHHEIHKNHAIEARKEIRMKVLMHYSKGTLKCALCDYNNINTLTIDHIKGDGSEHRKELGGQWKLYRWLISNDYPEGFRVLCRNCNWTEYLRIHNMGSYRQPTTE